MLTSEYESLERLAKGMALHEALDISDAGAWLDLDAGARTLAVQHLTRKGGTASDTWSRTPPDTAELALALCHPDGRVREATLTWAADTPELLPLVVIRTADWVAPVRERARALLQELLAARPVTAVDLLATLILRVARRSQGHFAKNALDRYLRRGQDPAVMSLLTSADRPTRRFAHRIALDERLLSPSRLARIAASDDDVTIQNMCAEAVLAAVTGPMDDDLLGPLLESRLPQVRSAGVTALKRSGRPADAEPYLVDSSSLVRACARWVLKQHGTDPVLRYRALCSGPGAVPAHAPHGLAECGAYADAELLWPLTTHPVAAVRAGAVTGLRLLDATNVDRLRVMLDDPAPAVARETAIALAPFANNLPEPWLTERIAADRPRHTRAAAFRVLCAQGGSSEQRAAQRMLSDADPKLRTRARQVAVRAGVLPAS